MDEYAVVIDVVVEIVEEAPPPLHDQTSLEIAANSEYGLSAKETMDASQELYEAGLISYPRTSSHNITPDMVPSVSALLVNGGGGGYLGRGGNSSGSGGSPGGGENGSERITNWSTQKALQNQMSEIIASRVEGLDLHEHHREKSLSIKQRKELEERIDNRTATKSEYNRFMSDKRFSERRKTGVIEFWKQERRRVKNGEETTREWSDSQIKTILKGGRPKYNGKTIQGHHAYSASKYPHLANHGEVIVPVTLDEHLYGWHGGNFKSSLPGKPISYQKKYNFREDKT